MANWLSSLRKFPTLFGTTRTTYNPPTTGVLRPTVQFPAPVVKTPTYHVSLLTSGRTSGPTQGLPF